MKVWLVEITRESRDGSIEHAMLVEDDPRTEKVLNDIHDVDNIVISLLDVLSVDAFLRTRLELK